MATCRVQHVNKASSDELLQKFAELGSETGRNPTRKSNFRGSIRRKKPRSDWASVGCDSPVRNNSVVEWRSLLSPWNPRRSGLFLQVRCVKSELRLIGIRGNRSLLAALEKTWRKTIEGASKIFVEKHYQRHVLLTDEVI